MGLTGSFLFLVLVVTAAALGRVDGLVDIKRGQLIESTATSKQLFGSWVAVSGDTLAVAAFASDGFKGAVFIYQNVDGTWERKQRLQPSELTEGDHFGWALSYSGDYLAAGAVGRKINGKKQGKVYIFERSGPGTDFSFVQSFIGDDNQDGDNYAYMCFLKGKNLFVSAEQGLVAEGSANGSGKVYYYRRSRGTWERKAMIRGDRFGDQFGDETAWASKTLAIGSPFADNDLTGIADTGAAYVYKREEGEFRRIAKLQTDDTTLNDSFGTTVLISEDGKMVVVGSDRANGEVSNSQGAAYIFKENSSGAWELDQKIIAMDGHFKAWFGYRMWLTGEFLAVTSYKKDDGDLNEAGAVYIFKKNRRGLYKESQVIRLKIRHEGDNFGVGIAVDGETMVVGSPRYDTNRVGDSVADTGLDNGAVQVFTVTKDPADAVNFLPRVIEIPASGSFKIGVEYSTSVSGVVRGQIKDGSTILSESDEPVSAGSGIVKVELTSNLSVGSTYTLKIALRQNDKAVKKRSIKEVLAVSA